MKLRPVGDPPIRIYVDREAIQENRKTNGDRPVFLVIANQRCHFARAVEIRGPSRLVYNRQNPPVGADAWIETHAEVEIVG